MDEVVVNLFDEVRGPVHVSIKTLHVEEIAVYIVKLKCPDSVLISLRINQPAWLMSFSLYGDLNLSGVSSAFNIQLQAGLHYSWVSPISIDTDLVLKGNATLFAVCLRRDMISRLLSEDEYATLKQSSETK